MELRTMYPPPMKVLTHGDDIAMRVTFSCCSEDHLSSTNSSRVATYVEPCTGKSPSTCSEAPAHPTRYILSLGENTYPSRHATANTEETTTTRRTGGDDKQTGERREGGERSGAAQHRRDGCLHLVVTKPPLAALLLWVGE